MNEVKKHGDPEVVRTLERKLESYKTLKTKAGDTPEISKLRGEDRNENDKVDTSMLAEVAADRVDILITEDRGIHRKAARLGLAGRVFTIYVTIFRRTIDQYRLIRLLEDWGFVHHGTKSGAEHVYVRDFRPRVDADDARCTFPYIAASAREFVVPIYPRG